MRTSPPLRTKAHQGVGTPSTCRAGKSLFESAFETRLAKKMAVSELPRPIEHVAVPELFAPSTWFRMERCALSVWAKGEWALPDSVKAVVGRVLHAAREEVLRRALVGPDNTQAVRGVIDAARLAEERQVEAFVDASVVSLVESYGARRWLQRTLWLEAWARGLPLRSAPFSRPQVLRATDPPTGGASSHDRFALGAEQWWVSTDLRLRGRPDEAQLTESGQIEITDYKTGFVVSREGHMAPSIETQLRLYLLMAETLTGRRAQGIVQGALSISVPWDDDLRDTTRRQVSRITQNYPSNATLDALQTATPGVHCSGCGLRPRCRSYLRQAPTWWPNTGDHPRPLPADTWGRVSSIKHEQIGVTVRLEDAAGRRVVVRGLNPARQMAHAATGTMLFLFDLESTEDGTLHGRRMHPRLFHERSPGPRWPSARTTSAYVGGG